MSTTVTVYKHTDTGAPSLKGKNPVDADTGVINVLDKCLVTGYGAKLAAGWTKPFSGTDKAGFQQGGGNQMYVQVDDSVIAGTIRHVNFLGRETMTAIDTGTGPFGATSFGGGGAPTQVTQFRSVDLLDIARPWLVIADNRTFYFFSDPSNTLTYTGIGFGDIFSFMEADPYRTGSFGGEEEGSGATSQLSALQTTLAGLSTSQSLVRNYQGTAGAVKVGLHGDYIKQGATSLVGQLPYPHPVDSKIWLAPVYVHETGSVVRGRLRGFWQWLHPTAGIADGDTFPGAGDFVGKTFQAIRDEESAQGIFIIETSSTWDTN